MRKGRASGLSLQSSTSSPPALCNAELKAASVLNSESGAFFSFLPSLGSFALYSVDAQETPPTVKVLKSERGELSWRCNDSTRRLQGAG